MNSNFEPNPAELFSFLSERDGDKSAFDNEEDATAVGKAIGETGKGAVIFCVDCSNIENMIEADFKRALSTVAKYMRNQIIASDGSEMAGLLFYNVRSSNNPLRQKGIHLVHSLSGLTARGIRDIHDLLYLDIDTFNERFGGRSNDADMSEVIFVCNAQFRRVSAAYTPRIIIFTENDEPCGTDRKAHQAAVTRANDFLNAFPNSQIQLIPFSGEGNEATFDVSKFWSSILRISASSESGEYLTSEALRFLSDVESHTLKKLFKKRPVNRVNIHLSDKAKIGMMMYTSFFPASKPRHRYVDGATLKPLKADSKYVADMTGEILDPDMSAGEMISYVEFNGMQVPLNREDVGEIRKLWPIDSGEITGNLFIVGFKPASSFLKPEYCVGHSCFLYPQEQRIAGSAELCSALITSLSDRGLVAIARAVPKANSTMTFVALVPQQEQIDEESGEQTVSPGFHLMRLPFADDIRDLSLPDTNVATLMAPFDEQNEMRKGQVERAKRIIDAMTEPSWDPEMLDNPALRLCFATLENLALGQESEEAVLDIVNPDSAKVSEADNFVVEWLNALSVTDTESLSCNAKPSIYKKAKVEDARQWTEAELKDMIKSGQIEKLTVAELKSIIERFDSLKNISSKGRKPELIQKILINFNV